MSRTALLVLGVALAVLADLLIVLVWRLRRSGKLKRLPGFHRRVPRFVAPLLIAAGAAMIFLGQSLEAPLSATGTRAVGWLSALGILCFILGGGSFRLSLADGKLEDHSDRLVRKEDPRTKGSQPIAGIQAESSGAEGEVAPRLELGALLLGAGVLLYLGNLMSGYLFGDLTFWSYVYTALGLGSFALAAVGFSARGLPQVVKRVLRAAAGWLGVQPVQIVLLLLAPLLALAAWLAAGESQLMRQPAVAVLSWLGGIGLVLVGGLARPPRLRRQLAFTPAVLALGALFLMAFLLRGLATEQIPWLFTGDEASAGLAAVQFVDGFRDNLFGVAWFSFPSLFFYVQSLFIRVFGQTAEALRVVSALGGALTVPATYALAKQMFGRRVAWVSAAYLAVFHFHIHFSRIGLNNVWDGFFVAAFSAALWWAWKSDHLPGFAAAGIVLGLSQYFYVSIRVVLPMFVLWLAAAWIIDRPALRRRAPGLFLLLLGLVVTCLPLAIFFARNPTEFQAPLNRVSALGPWLEAEARLTGRAPWQVLISQFRFAALGFTSVDLRLAYEPGQPLLLALPATLFLMGVSLIVLRIRELRSVWLGLWLLAVVVVSALSLSPPASQRYILVAPAVAILVALPLVTAADWIAQLWPRWRRAVTAAAVALLALAVWGDLRFYFGDYILGPRFGDINTETAQRLAELLAEKEGDTFVYFLGGRMGFRSHSNVPYLAPHVDGRDLPEPLSSYPELELSEHTLFVVLPERQAELNLIERAYPGGRTYQVEGRRETLFIAYELGGS